MYHVICVCGSRFEVVRPVASKHTGGGIGPPKKSSLAFCSIVVEGKGTNGTSCVPYLYAPRALLLGHHPLAEDAVAVLAQLELARALEVAEGLELK